VTRYTEGFSHFVTSMTAPVASGWSDGRVGLAPTGKAPPYHGAHPERSFRRGYQHGAYEVLQAILPRLSPSVAKILENWILKDLHRWRLKADVDETERVRPFASGPPSPPSL